MEMETSEKRSFLIYFDSFPCLENLTMEQRGQLFTALFQYAIDAARSELSPQDALARLNGLAPETRMAFLFLAGNVCRDTAAWRKKKSHYMQAAQRKKQERCVQAAQRRNSRPASSPKPAGCDQERDISWMGDYIRQRDAAHPSRDNQAPPPEDDPAGEKQRPDR